MTIQGAIADLNNLLNADDIPFYYKGSIKKVIETIEMEFEVEDKEKMTREDLIKIAESFVQWLKDTSAEYNLSESDLQAIIKQFLIG